MKTSVIRFTTRDAIKQFEKSVLKDYDKDRFIIKRRRHGTHSFSILIKEKISTANSNMKIEDSLDMNPQKDLVDDLNDLFNNVDKVSKERKKSFADRMKNARHDKNVYCDICGKYQTIKEFKKYKMCVRCYKQNKNEVKNGKE
tara:strand:- start:111 stop:539 length:429 start_codon:yes stop_codon:yes gene_type:complete